MTDKIQASLSRSASNLFTKRSVYSSSRLSSLVSSLSSSQNMASIPELCVFAAGSYGREEASEHSDIDLFFISSKPKSEIADLRVPSIRMFSDVIEAGSRLGFPKFSNDGEFLQLLFLDEIQNNMGSREDDSLNHFTSRMLLLLESKPIYGKEFYDAALESTISAYFRDYTHHPDDFKPTFLVNDIIRFWKTLCLNYEHGRNQMEVRNVIKQKIKNFKLKYSRLLTCFSTIAYLSTFRQTITPQEVVELCKLTPSTRLKRLADFDEALPTALVDVFEEYAWFMELTALSKEDLEDYFSDKGRRSEAFLRAQGFGDRLFQILMRIHEKNKVLRFMVL